MNAFAENALWKPVHTEQSSGLGENNSNAFLEEVAAKSEKTDAPAAEKSQAAIKDGTALGELKGAMIALRTNKMELTPTIKKQFDDAIALSDTPSPRLPELEKQAKQLASEMEKAFPKEKQEETGKLMEGINAKLEASHLSDQEKTVMAMMMQARDKADPANKKEIDAAINERVPGLAKDLDTVNELIKPLGAVEGKAKELVAEMKQEQQQDVLTRIAYAQVLHILGDDPQARKLIRDAAAKHQELLKDSSFMSFASQLDLDAKDLRTWQV
jgi:hypothetical protein